MLAASQVQVAGEVDKLLATHYLLTGARRDPDTLPAGQEVIQASHKGRQSMLLVRSETPIHDPAWTVGPVSLEDIVLAYMQESANGGRAHRPVLEVQQ